MQPQRCPRCRSTWTERKLSPRSRQSSRGSRKVVGDCAGGFHMAAGAVLGAASIYLRFIIQPTTAPDATPTTGVVAIVARRLRLQMRTRARGSQPRILSCTRTIGGSMLASALPVARLISNTSGSSRPKGSIQLEVHCDHNYHRSHIGIPLGEPSS
jgi:hypothetical protein